MSEIPSESQRQSEERFSLLLANTKQRLGNEVLVAAYQLVKQDYKGLLETADSMARLAKDAEYQRILAGGSK